MNRIKKHKMKKEKPETSTSIKREQQEHDLAYYIHDRVELMHQVFSVLKTKEIKAMAPESVRNISADDLQELCTEELLGISSKRLCAILDGGEPPSDTESSSPSPSPELETISLDSISSDDDVLSEASSRSKTKKKHKHRRRSKSKRSKGSGVEAGGGGGGGGAAGARGLTVLELLELQARARAIRAQLHNEHVAKAVCSASVEEACSEGEVEIKEEPPEVVEISSDEEKPDLHQLKANVLSTSKEPDAQTNTQENTQPSTTTKKINDLVITVPQTKPTRKIKLNRNKVVISVPVAPVVSVASTDNSNVPVNRIVQVKDKTKKKQKKKVKEKKKEKDGSDHDEITLQLSDSEKMDLLENYDRQHYETVSSSSEDSESSSDSDNDKTNTQKKNESAKDKKRKNRQSDMRKNGLGNVESVNGCDDQKVKAVDKDTAENTTAPTQSESPKDDIEVNKKCNDGVEETNDCTEIVKTQQETIIDVSLEQTDITQIRQDIVVNTNTGEKSDVIEITSINDNSKESNDNIQCENSCQSTSENTGTDDKSVCATVLEETTEKVEAKSTTIAENSGNNKSEGEVSDRESSEVEALDIETEVVCISDEEKHKKRKKEKKKSNKKKKEVTEENIEEIFELSDDSSCYEVAGTVLSKEPTAEEIEALSAKIDEIEREEVITEEEIKQYESLQAENVSWKDRYLDSKKVKRVLSTANILNALRKKNRELKKRIEDTKIDKEVVKEPTPEPELESHVEGSIDHFNTLQGSNKYVDPVKEPIDKESEGEDTKVTKEMKKDAKQLLKMYKRLLKYNDMNKQKDPSKKKKKKAKKSKAKDKEASSVAVTENT